MATFVGFSTVGKKKPPFKVIDTDLIKRDLLNHFNTRKGERVMLPNFGTTIHDLIMDPLDEYTKSVVVDEARAVIDADPRVRLLNNILVTERDYGIRLEIELQFISQNITERLYIDFKKAADEAL